MQSPCDIPWCLSQESFTESFREVHCASALYACIYSKIFLSNRIALVFSTILRISEEVSFGKSKKGGVWWGFEAPVWEAIFLCKFMARQLAGASV